MWLVKLLDGSHAYVNSRYIKKIAPDNGGLKITMHDGEVIMSKLDHPADWGTLVCYWLKEDKTVYIQPLEDGEVLPISIRS